MGITHDRHVGAIRPATMAPRRPSIQRMDGMLEIKNLCARVEEKEILKGITLTIKEGEVHAIMGPLFGPHREQVLPVEEDLA